MSSTHGARGIKFVWDFSEEDGVSIKNEKGRYHFYTTKEIVTILNELFERFGNNWFPLANNVEKLGKGTEQFGLGMAILSQQPGNITHAQGSSYLGVVLEESGILKWNEEKKGIRWKIKISKLTDDNVIDHLLCFKRRRLYIPNGDWHSGWQFLRLSDDTKERFEIPYSDEAIENSDISGFTVICSRSTARTP